MACGETDVGVAVHVGHGARFRGPVRGGVLDDAEGIDPEVGDGHGAGGVEFNVVTRNAVIGSREECCIGEKLAEQP